MKKGVIVLVVLMAVIFCGNASAMYQYQPTYPPETYQPDMPTVITEEDLNNLLVGGGGSSNFQDYINSLHPSSQENVVQEGSNIQSGDSSQGTSTDSSASTGSSPYSDSTGSTGSSTGTAVNNSPNTATESGTSTDDNGKSDESSKVGTSSSSGTPWGAYAVGGIISVLAIGAVGFYYKGGKFGR